MDQRVRYQEQIRINGLVQGVGFRPHVWRLAHEFKLTGHVSNDGNGVTIIIQGEPENCAEFLTELRDNPPGLARITQVEKEQLHHSENFADFEIIQTEHSDLKIAIVPDAATCPDCLSDITDPDNRRFGYAFTNCTHCGPRYSIVEGLPYDREQTSMRHFQMCPDCLTEYKNPADRRFHAQPNACPECGPELWLTTNDGELIETNDPIMFATRLIHVGKIVAIKGIGGYQLVCDAANTEAVDLLRERKNRPAKPFAVMAKNIDQIKACCHVSAAEEAVLSNTAAPIVLLRAKKNGLAESIAPGHNRLGFVLPYSPLHHSLMRLVDRPVIFTSGNLSQLPQCTEEANAEEKLRDIVDVFLHHNRPISNRVDDSVVSVYNDQEYFFRRSRGYAPTSMDCTDNLACGLQVLACGSQMKNTFTMLKDNHLISSQYIGDLDNPVSMADYRVQLDRQLTLFQLQPELVVVDKHPDYQASRFGKTYADENNLEVLEVQHHHAHMAACMFDNNHQPDAGDVVALVLDGLGFGDDHSIWGGEILLGNYHAYERVGALDMVPMPGGTQAILEPWRMLFSHLLHTSQREQINLEELTSVFSGFKQKPVKQLAQMVKHDINAPLTSSCGRLFDAVAAALDICFNRITYEGQAAIELQQIAQQADSDASAYTFQIDHTSMDFPIITTAPLWQELITDLKAGIAAGIISRRFHQGLAKALSKVAIDICHEHNLETIALCGGVFQNEYLLSLCQEEITAAGLNTYIHQRLPANDACISVGQAIIAGQIKRSHH